MAEKMSGMEMMMNSLLKAAGFDPTELKLAIENTIGGFQNMAREIFNRIDAIDKRQAIIDARLERLELHLGVGAEVAHSNGDGRKALGGPKIGE